MSPPTEPVPRQRWAVYAAPLPHTRWWQAGSTWLGRCAASGQALAQPTPAGLSPAQWAALTASPRRYGWHATLKAPFVLRPGTSPQRLARALAQLASGHRAIAPMALQVQMLGDFLALVPASPQPALHALAAACVTELHPLAAPLPPEELARRRARGLSPRQEELLQQWGYPHVLEQFRFHFTLGGPLHALSPAQREAVAEAARAWFEPLGPLALTHVSLFLEPAPGADLRWQEAFALGARDPGALD